MKKLFFISIFSLLLAALGTPDPFANEPPLSVSAPSFKFGMEVELMEEAFSRIIHLFDSHNPEVEAMAPLIRAKYIIDHPEHIPQLKLREPVSPETAEVFKNLHWIDGKECIEFIHKEPVTAKEELIKDIRGFARLVGIEHQFDDPISRFGEPPWYSFHFHISKAPSPRKRKVLRDPNFLRFMRALNLKRWSDYDNIGRGERVLSMGFSKYKSFRYKGLVRAVSDNWMEVRTPMQKLELDVDFAVDALGADSLEKAIQFENEVLEKLEKMPREKLLKLFLLNPQFVADSMDLIFERHGLDDFSTGILHEAMKIFSPEQRLVIEQLPIYKSYLADLKKRGGSPQSPKHEIKLYLDMTSGKKQRQFAEEIISATPSVLDSELVSHLLKLKDPVVNFGLAQKYFLTGQGKNDRDNFLTLLKEADDLTLAELRKMELGVLGLGVQEIAVKRALAQKTRALRLEFLDKSPSFGTWCWALFH